MDLLLMYRGLLPHDSDHGQETRETPYGLYCIAAVTQKKGFEVSLFNTSNLSGKKEDDLIQSLPTPNLLIGLSQFTVNRHAVYYLAKKLRQRFPNTPIVIGGIHATLFAENILSIHPEIDYVVLGEGEYPIIELLNTLKKKNSVNNIPGIAYRSNGKIFINEPLSPPDDLDSLPSPIQYYPISYIQTTRGCPYKCSYCSTNAINQRWVRLKSINHVIEDIKTTINEHSITHITFSDDLFLCNEKRSIEFGNAVEQIGVPFTFDCNLRVNNINEKVIKELIRCGCTRVMFGIESASEKILNIYNKKITLEQIASAVKLCRKYCLQTGLSFIFCGIHDDDASYRETVNLIERVKPTDIITAPLYLYPGSQLYVEAVSAGKLHPGIWEKEASPLPKEAYAGYPEFHSKSFYFSQKLQEYFHHNENRFNYTSAELNKAWEKFKFPVIGLKLATQYFHEKQLQAGEEIFDALKTMGYNNINVSIGKAMIYLQKGMTSKAMAIITGEKERYPKSKQLHLAMGEISEQSQAYDEALEYYKNAYLYEEGDKIQLQFKCGLIYEKIKHYSRAFETYCRLLDDFTIYSPNLKQFLNIKIKQLEHYK